ncbi:MAG: hypothetical protein ACJAT7_000114 [Psychromonas sp.]|jgi:hypothetical protein|uniref:putative Ig domain-containing protein n=1 Tax=Psychromonas sp. TaxID=1884585 RepID=UPI0039E529A9
MKNRIRNKPLRSAVALALTLALTACGDEYASIDSTNPDSTDVVVQNPVATVEETVNQPPVITSSEVLTATRGTNYSYTITASDADGDNVTFSSENLPAWLTLDKNSGVLTGTPGANDQGEQAITIMASDAINSTAHSFTIRVFPDQGDPVPLPVASGEKFAFISSTDAGDLDFGVAVVGEWSTSTIISETTYDGLNAWRLDAGPNSPEAGNWGTVLALSGGMAGDFSEFTTLKLKIATSGGYESFAITLIANGVSSEVTLPVDGSINSWQDVSVDLEDFSLNLSDISSVAVFGVGGTNGTSSIYIADLAIYADQNVSKDSELESDFVFISSDDSILSNLVVDDDNNSAVGNVIFGEWSTQTQIADATYDGLSGVSLGAVAGWGAVLALQGDISDGTNIDNYDVDFEEYTNIKFKVASNGAFDRYALSIISSVNGNEAAQEISFSLADASQWNDIDINLEKYGVDLSNVNQLAVFGVYPEGVAAGQTLYITDFIAYDSGVQAAVKPSLSDKFVLLSSSGEEVDLRVDDNGLINEGNITFSDWSTGSILNGAATYNGLSAFEVTKGSGWGAVLALMGDIYGGVQSWEIDVSKYQTINFSVAATGGFSAYTVDFVVDGSEYKMPIQVSSSWNEISINVADIPLDLNKLTQIAIFGEGGNAGDKLYVTDFNIAK